MVGRVQGVAVRCGWVCRRGSVCIDSNGGGEKRGRWKDWSCAR